MSLSRCRLGRCERANKGRVGVYRRSIGPRSLRPAAFNGLVGFKPSFGWWSARGVVPACRTLDCVSVFAGTLPTGLPFGVTLIAPAGKDHALLDYGELTRLGGYPVSSTRTSTCYRLYALPDGKRPALIRNETGGAAIAVEVWKRYIRHPRATASAYSE